MVKLTKLVNYLDTLLETEKIQDASINGLQVEGKKNIAKIAFAVDMTYDTAKRAASEKADMLIVHHGLLWKNSPFTLTGIHKSRIKLLFDNEISLYASHLPLDLHNKYGNNITICKLLCLKNIELFGSYHGVKIGYCGELKNGVDFKAFLEIYSSKIAPFNGYIDSGVKVKKICVVSGGGSGLFDDCVKTGADTFITGEQNYTICNFAKEHKINIVFGGHYNTETFGVSSLMKHLESKFKDLKTVFIDCPSSI